VGKADLIPYNGEGCLVYPGAAVGVDGPVAGLRLKAIRDSIEDYEYLAILERRGMAKEAEAAIAPHLRKLRPVGAAGPANLFLGLLAPEPYLDPAAWEEVRAELARLITGEKRRKR
jgi:hypothetical protein